MERERERRDENNNRRLTQSTNTLASPRVFRLFIPASHALSNKNLRKDRRDGQRDRQVADVYFGIAEGGDRGCYVPRSNSEGSLSGLRPQKPSRFSVTSDYLVEHILEVPILEMSSDFQHIINKFIKTVQVTISESAYCRVDLEIFYFCLTKLLKTIRYENSRMKNT